VKWKILNSCCHVKPYPGRSRWRRGTPHRPKISWYHRSGFKPMKMPNLDRLAVILTLQFDQSVFEKFTGDQLRRINDFPDIGGWPIFIRRISAMLRGRWSRRCCRRLVLAAGDGRRIFAPCSTPSRAAQDFAGGSRGRLVASSQCKRMFEKSLGLKSFVIIWKKIAKRGTILIQWIRHRSSLDLVPQARRPISLLAKSDRSV
jgi:hypothetical protein